ncbi:uncharacterized protein LOC126894259 [Daktulosphaira vitifoliae]|uniref:uncharacterized protein LOC126894259 n=3 Tax=Daktulosphaira vitifoliae TaxID=58002 RepID=UPI0021A9FEF0|nr:uncharacterized protein LOC126894259 [Daktulosphaira vitifoliae]
MTIQLTKAPDITMVARTIDLLTMCSTGLYKWYCMVKFSDEFIVFDTQLVQIQTQGLVSYGSEAQQFTRNHLRPMKKITIIYLLCGFFMDIIIIFSTLITYPKNGRSDSAYFNDPKSYPLSCWIPFTVNNYQIFTGIIIVHAVVLIAATNMYLAIDTYMFGSIYAIGGQINLLNTTLNNISDRLKLDHNDGISCLNYRDYQQEKLSYLVVQCAKHHALILKYIRKLRNMYNYLILVDYMHAITSLTFAIFQMQMSFGTGESIALVLFVVISLYHQFLNNFFGEYILQKQSSISVALYNVPWWRANKNVRQLLMFMIARTNMQTNIMGFYMYKLCLKSFIAFVKALYTYYMVLRQMNQTST